MNKPIALTPPMGWNSWNTFTWDINEKMICEMADRMVEDGYLEAGYEYLVIDDCWSLKQRDADGNLVPDPEKFPHGMKWVSLCTWKRTQIRHVFLCRNPYLRRLSGQF